MWILAVAASVAACVLLFVLYLQLRRRLDLLNELADVAAAWCEAQHG